MKSAAILAILAGALFVTGCASLDGDPIVIRSEQVQAVSFHLFDSFLRFEHQFNAQGELGRDIRTFAEHLRRHGPDWFDSAAMMTRLYKTNRTPENKLSLLQTIAILETAAFKANEWLAHQESNLQL